MLFEGNGKFNLFMRNMFVQKVKVMCTQAHIWLKKKLGLVPKDYYYKQSLPMLKKDDNASVDSARTLAKTAKNALFAIENIIEVDELQPQLKEQAAILSKAILAMVGQDSESNNLDGISEKVVALTSRSKVFLETFKQEFKSEKNMPETCENRVNVRWIAHEFLGSKLL